MESPGGGPPVRGEAGPRLGLPLAGAGPLDGGAEGLKAGLRAPLLAVELLHRTVCGRCNLGPAGLGDDAAPGLHLCGQRLDELACQLRDPVIPADLVDIARLSRDEAGLRALGRVVQPFHAQGGRRGYDALSWASALDGAESVLRGTPPERVALLLRPAGGSMESLLAAAEAWMGPERIFLAREAGAAEAQRALAEVLGVEGASCRLAELVQADLILLFGVDARRSHPDLLRLLVRAKERGARVVAFARAEEAVSVRARTFASPADLLFGARVLDDLFLDEPMAWVEALRAVHDPRRAEEPGSGPVPWLATLLGRARRVVSVLGAEGLDSPEVARALGREVATLHQRRPGEGGGLLPLFEDEGERGARALGLGGDAEGLVAWLESDQPPQLLLSLGEEPLGALRRTDRLLLALERVPDQIHLVGRPSPLHLRPGRGGTWLLPVCSRFTQPGGAIVATMERRLRFSAEAAGLAVGDALPAWAVLAELDRRARGAPRGSGEGSGLGPLRERLAARHPDWRAVVAFDAPGDSLTWSAP